MNGATAALIVDAARVAALEPDELLAAAEVCRRYRDLALGLADASIVVLADRFGTHQVASFEERHFRAIQPLAGGAFTLLPPDRRENR